MGSAVAQNLAARCKRSNWESGGGGFRYDLAHLAATVNGIAVLFVSASLYQDPQA